MWAEKPEKLISTQKQNLVTSAKTMEEFKEFLTAKGIPIDDPEVKMMLKAIDEGELELIEKRGPLGLPTLTSIFGKLKTKFQKWIFWLTIGIVVWNIVIFGSYFIKFLIYVIGHLNLISWGVPGFKIPIIQLEMILDLGLNVFIHIFSFTFIITFNGMTTNALRIAGIFLFTSTLITIICSGLAKIAFIIMEFGFVLYECTTIVSIVTCNDSLLLALIFHASFLIWELLLMILFMITLIIVGLLIEYNIYKTSPKVWTLFSGPKAKQAKASNLLEDDIVQKQVYALAKKFGYDKIINYSKPVSKEPLLQKTVEVKKSLDTTIQIDTRKKVEPNVSFYKKE
jgi:hypothetical protein